ncbi:MAG TPA: HNH endonuclease signature motif containing protein [Candidatus Acidoferrales bacterium]|nr:HNH endonuclease signature motif containing protein [Candidatus Acidoferrales bacterium]
MRDDIITYREMCDREGIQTLQRGMNFQLHRGHSVVLMSQRANAPYEDQILSDGITIEYEGHDASRTEKCPDPKAVDQPRFLPSGKLTQNGLFAFAVDQCKAGKGARELVRVYEKVFPGVWSDKGLFALVGYELKRVGNRNVFRFFLRATDEAATQVADADLPVTRLIPAEVKQEVWKRDQGRCSFLGCGRKDNLHFDHDIPFSKGGSSVTSANIRLLCARHNLQKHDRIE